MTCATARALIQETHDDATPAQAGLEEHLGGCPQCSVFRSFVLGLGSEIRADLERDLAEAAPIEWAAVIARAESARRLRRAAALRRLLHVVTARLRPLIDAVVARPRLAIQAAAAVLVVGVGIGVGLLAWRTNQANARVSSSIESFVDSLFADPLLPGVEYAGASDGASGLAGLPGETPEEIWVDQLFTDLP